MRSKVMLLAVFTAAATLVGCGVSKQVVAEKDAALETCSSNLSACEERLQTAQDDAAGLRSQLAATRSRAETLGVDLDDLSEQAQQEARAAARAREDLAATRNDLEAAVQRASSLQQTEEDLRLKLEKQMRECTVDIERLRGQLRVRMLDKLFFAPGSVDILPEGQAVLDQIAASLKGGEGQLRIEGHTDEMPIGSNLKNKWFSNWELSAARAASVVRYFQYAHGLDPKRMAVVGRSAFQPRAPNDTPENRQLNRRVEIVLSQLQ